MNERYIHINVAVITTVNFLHFKWAFYSQQILFVIKQKKEQENSKYFN